MFDIIDQVDNVSGFISRVFKGNNIINKLLFKLILGSIKINIYLKSHYVFVYINIV